MVYVDDMYLHSMGQFGRMKMSHLIADTDEELHAMAAKIGVARKWWQAPPHSSHYDIAMTKRLAAIAAGAIPITLRQCAAMDFRRKATGQLGKPEEAEAWRAEWVKARRAALAEKAKEVEAAFDRPIGTK